jgi:hypothetical protein
MAKQNHTPYAVMLATGLLRAKQIQFVLHATLSLQEVDRETDGQEPTYSLQLSLCISSP